MADIFKVVDGTHEAFSATHHAAGDTLQAAGSADAEATNAAVGAALGPIGAHYLAAYAPAQANCLAATLQLGHVHHAIGHAISAHKATIVASDNA